MNGLPSHKRTFSANNASQFKPIKPHIRTNSSVPSSAITKSYSLLKSAQKSSTVSEFVGLLDAAETYFREESFAPTVFPVCELDELKKRLSKEMIKSSELQSVIEEKQKEFVRLSKYIEEKKDAKENLESALKKLKLLRHSLDLEYFDNGEQIEYLRKCLAHDCLRTQQPSPVPIKYKPVRKRLSRNLSNCFSGPFNVK